MYRTLLAALMPLALGLRGTSESLRKALVNVGLELTEQHLYGQQRSEEAPPFMVLMPGLGAPASRAWTRETLCGTKYQDARARVCISPSTQRIRPAATAGPHQGRVS